MLEPGATVTDPGEKVVPTVVTIVAPGAGVDGADGAPGEGFSAGGLFVDG